MGRKTNNDKVSSVINTGRINEIFQMINTGTQCKYNTYSYNNPPWYSYDVSNAMMNLKRTGSGPVGIPYWLWKEFAYLPGY